MNLRVNLMLSVLCVGLVSGENENGCSTCGNRLYSHSLGELHNSGLMQVLCVAVPWFAHTQILSRDKHSAFWLLIGQFTFVCA